MTENGVRICWGPINVAYVRVGRRGLLERVGTICRQCGPFERSDTPEAPPLAGCREATPEEVAQWQRERQAEWRRQDQERAARLAAQGDETTLERERRLVAERQAE